MAVKIRLKRTGRRHRMSYRIVACDARATRDGTVLERLGSYDPEIADDAKKVQLKPERVEHWLRVGAVPSPTVKQLLRRQGIKVSEVRAKMKAEQQAQ